jgi:hypothetical protein
MSKSRPSRLRAAALFASVGLIAGTAHVLTSDAENLRLWREVLPLAALVGGVLGAVFRPLGWRKGAHAALLAVFAFSIAYGVAETAILASRNEVSGLAGWTVSIFHWMGVVLSKAAIGAVTATLAGGFVGFWLHRRNAHDLD